MFKLQVIGVSQTTHGRGRRLDTPQKSYIRKRVFGLKEQADEMSNKFDRRPLPMKYEISRQPQI